jgi:hypothetical protein
MRFNVSFDFKGPAGIAKGVPAKENPVTCTDLPTVLRHLASYLPEGEIAVGNLVEVIGIHVEAIEET